jgi:hypothetical protein
MPYDAMDPDQALEDLCKAGFISRYEAEGVRVIQVLTWDKHQNPHIKEAASTLPQQDRPGSSTVQEQDDTQPLPERAGLIPDSGFRIPDSPLTDSNTHTPVEDPPAPPAPHPVAACVLPQQAMDAFGAMRIAGISDGHAGHPDLLALVTAGAMPAEFQSAAADAVGKSKGFAYAIGTLKRQRINAASSLAAMHKGPMPVHETPRQKAAIDRAIELSGGILNVRRGRQSEYIDADTSQLPALG